MFVTLTRYDEAKGIDWKFAHELKSDANGFIHLREPNKYRGFLYVRHAGRKLVAMKRTDLEKHDRPLVLTMHPECHVTWKLTCSALNRADQKIGALKAIACGEGMMGLWCAVNDCTVHALLPPGEFRLVGHGDHVNAIEMPIVINPGQREFDAGTTDMIAKPWVLKIGKSAPEITDVVEWKNGPPIKLTELQGKVVLVDFWGWWCGPCVKGCVPALIEMHEELSREGLVIVGIHTPHGEEDAVDTVQELDEQTAEVRAANWKGINIPYPVAMTRYRKMSHFPGGEEIAKSRMCVEYGVDSFPTTILIDREGKIVGRVNVRRPEVRDQIRKMLTAR